MIVTSIKPTSEWYSQLQGKVDENTLHLQDARGVFLLDKVGQINLKYFHNYCVDKPWGNHLLFGILVQADRNLDVQTRYVKLRTIHTRINDFFSTYLLYKMDEFDVDVHMYKYLKGEIYPEHSNNMRKVFLEEYNSLAYSTKKWIAQKLNLVQQAYFEQFLFPMPLFDSRDFSFRKLAKE